MPSDVLFCPINSPKPPKKYIYYVIQGKSANSYIWNIENLTFLAEQSLKLFPFDH